MVMMTVEMVLTNHQNTVKAKDEPASEIFLHVTMGTVFPEHTFVTVTTIAWTTATKIADINAVCYFVCLFTSTTTCLFFKMIDFATKKRNLHAKPIKRGEEHNAYHGNGCATGIPIA